MMPNVVDLYAGMTPDLSQAPDFEPRNEREPRTRRSGGLVGRLSRMTGRLFSLLF